jgi:hypothetical protein
MYVQRSKKTILLGLLLFLCLFCFQKSNAQAATFSYFTIDAISSTTANGAININVTAYDTGDAIITSVPGTTDLQVLDNVGSPISNANEAWVLTAAISSASFSGDGTYSETLRIRKAGSNISVRITHSSVGNTDSNTFNVNANVPDVYKIIMPGQTFTPGERYSGIWGISGALEQQQAGVAFNVSIVATDEYGNLENQNETLTTWDVNNTNHLLEKDPKATVSPNPIVLSSGSAYPSFTLIKAMASQSIGVTGSLTGMTTTGTTINPGAFFGLQVLVPGLVVVEGSGSTRAAGVPGPDPVGVGGWYSGVTPTNPAQAIHGYYGYAHFDGYYFSVTVQAADMYGNFVSTAPSDTINLKSDDTDSNAEPNASADLSAVLTSGKVVFSVKQETEGLIRRLKAENATDPSIKDETSPDNSWVEVRIVQSPSISYRVFVEGISEYSSGPVYIDQAPGVFTMEVQTIYDGTGEICQTTQAFVIEPSLTKGSFTPASGALGITSGETVNGRVTINNQTYNMDESFYILARNPLDDDSIGHGYSVELRLRNSLTVTPTPTPANLLRNVDLKGKYCLVYPNPGRDKMNFLVHLDQSAKVQVVIYNVASERIAYITQQLPAGRGQKIEWNCADIGPGIYIYRLLINGEEKEKRKIALIN